MNKAFSLWALGHLPINHLFTPRSHHSSYCVKCLWPSQNSTVLPSLPYLSMNAFPHFFLPSVPSTYQHSSTLLAGRSFPYLYATLLAIYFSMTFSFCLSQAAFSAVFISQLSFSCALLQPCTLTCCLQCYSLSFSPLHLLHCSPPDASSGACKGTKNAVWVVKSVFVSKSIWDGNGKVSRLKEKKLNCLHSMFI